MQRQTELSMYGWRTVGNLEQTISQSFISERVSQDLQNTSVWTDFSVPRKNPICENKLTWS